MPGFNAPAPPARSYRRPTRTVELILRPDAGGPGAVSIAMGKREDTYTITPILSDYGRAYLVEKIADGTTYAVNIDGRMSACECMGYLRHGHCKHVDTLRELHAAGTI